MTGSRSPFHGCHTPVSACGVLHRCVRPLFWGVSRNLGISIDEFFGITVAPHAGASKNNVDGKEERRSVLPPSYKKFSPEDLC